MEVFTRSSEEVSVLHQEAVDTYVCFYRKRPIRRLLSIISSVPGGYLSTPYEVRDGRLRITLLGNARSLRIFLKTLQKERLHPKIVSLTDAVFSLNSPLERLTEKQKTVIMDAFKNGYYDFPRKIGSRRLPRNWASASRRWSFIGGRQNANCLPTCSAYPDRRSFLPRLAEFERWEPSILFRV
jgi:hypothetical protein